MHDAAFHMPWTGCCHCTNVTSYHCNDWMPPQETHWTDCETWIARLIGLSCMQNETLIVRLPLQSLSPLAMPASCQIALLPLLPIIINMCSIMHARRGASDVQTLCNVGAHTKKSRQPPALLFEPESSARSRLATPCRECAASTPAPCRSSVGNGCNTMLHPTTKDGQPHRREPRAWHACGAVRLGPRPPLANTAGGQMQLRPMRRILLAPIAAAPAAAVPAAAAAP